LNYGREIVVNYSFYYIKLLAKCPKSVCFAKNRVIITRIINNQAKMYVKF